MHGLSRNARTDSNRSLYCKDFGVFFVGKLENIGLSFCIFEELGLKLLALSHALIQTSFVGLLALSFRKKWVVPQGREDTRRRETGPATG